MARKFTIDSIQQSGGVGNPGKIVLNVAAGNQVSSFNGKLWFDPAPPHSVVKSYITPAPAGYKLLQATSFDIVDNPSYSGRYTVYSPISGPDDVANPASAFVSSKTEIHVSEIIAAPANVGDDLIGTVTNISTYVIPVAGEGNLIVPPGSILVNRPLEITGRSASPWGEAHTQNLIEIIQNYASGTAPANPYLGMNWFNTSTNTFNIYDGSAWVPMVSTVPGGNSTYRYTQGAASTTWTINHSLGLASPFVCLIQLFVDVGAGVHKPILPNDVTFNSANQTTVTFSTAYKGIALIRP